MSASGGTGKVKITFGDGTSTTHATGTFNISHKFAICEAHSKTDTQHFTVSDSGGAGETSTTTVTITYTGPICSHSGAHVARHDGATTFS